MSHGVSLSSWWAFKYTFMHQSHSIDTKIWIEAPGVLDQVGRNLAVKPKSSCAIWKALWFGVCLPVATPRDVCLLQVLYPFCQHHTKYLAVTKMPAEPEKLDLMSNMFSRTTSSVQTWRIRIGSQWRNYFRQQSSVTYHSVFKKSS